MTLVVAGRIEGFAWEPGKNAGYVYGRNRFRNGRRHYTAGACGGDRSVGLRGYFGAYVPKVPTCGPGATQFAELDAICFDACEWNPTGTGLEVERRTDAESFTDYQVDKAGLWVAACIEAGIPDRSLRPPEGQRFTIGTDLRGFVDHRHLQQKACDPHYDGWSDREIGAVHDAAMRHLGQTAPDERRRRDMPVVVSAKVTPTKIESLLIEGGVPVHQFTGTPHPEFGLPVDAIAYATAIETPGVITDPARFAKLKARLDGQAVGTVTVDGKQLAKDFLAELGRNLATPG